MIYLHIHSGENYFRVEKKRVGDCRHFGPMVSAATVGCSRLSGVQSEGESGFNLMFLDENFSCDSSKTSFSLFPSTYLNINQVQSCNS